MSAADLLAGAAGLLFAAAALDAKRTHRVVAAVGWLLCAAILVVVLLAQANAL